MTRTDIIGYAIAIPLTALSAIGWFYGVHTAPQGSWLSTFVYTVPPFGVVYGWGKIVGFW